MFALEEGHLVEVHVDGGVRHLSSIPIRRTDVYSDDASGAPCQGSSQSIVWQLATSNEDQAILHVVDAASPTGTSARSTRLAHASLGCRVDGKTAILPAFWPCAGQMCGRVDRMDLETFATKTLLTGKLATMYAALDGPELLWIGEMGGEAALWSTIEGKTRKVAPSPRPKGAQCCAFVVSPTSVFVAADSRVVRIARATGDAQPMFDAGPGGPASTYIQHVALHDNRIAVSFGKSIVELDVDGRTTPIATGTSAISRFVRSEDRSRWLWCSEDGVYALP